ncbi:MAG TPA: helix-turn-helix transcriptional regulator [Bacillota bacterium]
MNQASAVAAPRAAGAGVTGFKPEMDRLRGRMHGLGLSYDEIDIGASRRYLVRPRQACRLAWGRTLDQVAERFSELAADAGTDPDGRAGTTGSHLWEPKKRPDSERKPSVYALGLMARAYETDVPYLLDLVDHESLPQQDQLVLVRHRRAETPFGEQVLALAEERGLSLRELARRVPCDASRLPEVVHGRKRPSLRVAPRLDDVLGAAGAALDEEPDRQDAGRRLGEARTEVGGSVALTPPCVTALLVTEVSGPAGDPGLLAGAVGPAGGCEAG